MQHALHARAVQEIIDWKICAHGKCNPQIFHPTSPEEAEVHGDLANQLPTSSPEEVEVPEPEDLANQTRKRPFPGDEVEDEVLIVNKTRRLVDETQHTSKSYTVFDPFMDHSYCDREDNMVDLLDSATTRVSCQTDITLDDLKQWEKKAEEMKTENASLSNKCSDKTALKRDLFHEDVMKSDESVKFYTGIPSRACLLILFDVHRIEAEKMKYWDGNKDKTSYEQNGRRKPGPKRCLTLMEEFILPLVRLYGLD